ncbi:hypothetical protein JW887_00020 [Candidatus Dojkabacteria bacterium]|nr:hypothetical protein [Candidatus Dojkabacteria bacterium]
MFYRCVDDCYLNDLIDNGLFNDALEYLNSYYSEDAPDYLFYLAYLQGVLGWTQEAMQTLQDYKTEVRGTELESTVSGFLADIYSDDNWMGEAMGEITHALELEPDSKLIQEKYQEIGGKYFNDIFSFIFFISNFLNNYFKRS